MTASKYESNYVVGLSRKAVKRLGLGRTTDK